MHELSLCQSAVELITQQLAQQNVKRVTAVWFELGAMACIEEQALRFAFECASQGTIMADAKVHLIAVPVRAWCWDCNCSVELVDSNDLSCPQCHGQNLRTDTSDELRIKEVEVE